MRNLKIKTLQKSMEKKSRTEMAMLIEWRLFHVN